MAGPLSLDLRECAVAAVGVGESCRSVAARFSVSASSVIRWAARQRETGGVAARPMGGVRRAVLAGQRDWLLGRIRERPDLTLAMLAAELRGRGVVVAISVVWRFFRAEGISFKKSLCAAEQDRPDVARRRERWRRYQGRLDPARLVFIDETWTKTNMVRTHSRCAVGQRLVTKPPTATGRR